MLLMQDFQAAIIKDSSYVKSYRFLLDEVEAYGGILWMKVSVEGSRTSPCVRAATSCLLLQ